jgi:dethiobiotin synthetase
MRPTRLVVVAGTGTEVGKTWVSVELLRALRARGVGVAARKPAQSFEPGDVTDADLLGAASGEDPTTVCPPARWYPVAMAPPIAAEELGTPAFTVAELADGIHWPSGPTTFGLVETAGGVRSPQASDGDVTDLVDRLAPDLVVLVADAGLGTINAVRSSIDALGGDVLVALNRYDGSEKVHRTNRDWLVDRDGFSVVVLPDQMDDLAMEVLGPEG